LVAASVLATVAFSARARVQRRHDLTDRRRDGQVETDEEVRRQQRRQPGGQFDPVGPAGEAVDPDLEEPVQRGRRLRRERGGRRPYRVGGVPRYLGGPAVLDGRRQGGGQRRDRAVQAVEVRARPAAYVRIRGLGDDGRHGPVHGRVCGREDAVGETQVDQRIGAGRGGRRGGQHRQVRAASGVVEHHGQPELQRVHQVVGVQVRIKGQVGVVPDPDDQIGQRLHGRVVGRVSRGRRTGGLPGADDQPAGGRPRVAGAQGPGQPAVDGVHRGDLGVEQHRGPVAGDRDVAGLPGPGGQLDQRREIGDAVTFLGAEGDLGALQSDVCGGDEAQGDQEHQAHHDELLRVPQPADQRGGRPEQKPDGSSDHDLLLGPVR
jgi:hypothetical protein